jgi:uncharacterized protein
MSIEGETASLSHGTAGNTRLAWIALVALVVALATGYAVRVPPGISLSSWLVLGLTYVLLAAVALVRLARNGQLAPLFGFRRGDPTLGILLGLSQLGAAWLIAKVLVPAGAPERGWLMRVFLLVGDASEVTVALLLILLVACEEIVWRGLVQSELRDAFGPRRGWIAAAVLYAAAHLPTLVTLEDPAAGKNPLVVLAALGCGLCWSFLAEKSGRLVPGLFAHGVFSYFAAQSFWLFV